MTTQYYCGNEKRRKIVHDTTDMHGSPVLNGMDYLEVVSADEMTLQVHFIHNLPGQPSGFPTSPALADGNFVVEGGVRIQGITVKVTATANDVITLQASARGDYSTYVLRLVAGEGRSDPPDGFDPQLASLRFTFKIDCDSDFDCAPVDECPPENLPAPLIDYLAKDYGSFRRLMLDRLSTIMPDWKERNPADMQVALVEAVAYLGDQLSYYQDAVATEAYLGTARQRISLRRHARLLDYRMHDGSNARAWIYFYVEPGSAADGYTLSAGTPLLTRGQSTAAIVSPSDYAQVLQQEAPTVFETLHDLTLHSAHNGIRFYTWDDEDCCLPKGATRATLYNTPQLSLQVGDVLIFEEAISPATGLPEDADPAHRCAVRLTEVTTQDKNKNPLVDPLHNMPIVEIAWDAQDALPFPLCLSAQIDTGTGPQLVPDLSLARGNILLADHGLTVSGEDLGLLGTDAAGRLIERTLQNGPLTQQGHARDRFGQPVLDANNQPVVFDPSAPAAAAFQWQLGDALPAARLREHADQVYTWLPQHDLLASSRFDRDFVVEVDNDSLSHLRFGDGFHGAVPRPDVDFTADYRIGNGTAGNVGAEAISRVVLGVDGIDLVRNPLPAAGGFEPESMEQVRQYAPQAFRVQERAVTVEDYAAMAERHPEVQKAAATLRWTGSWYTVFVAVDRLGGRPVDAPFKVELLAFLERFRLAGEDLEIDTPLFVPLDIEWTVCVQPGYYRSQVKQDLLVVFGSRDLPDGRRGFFHPDNFTFGQPVYLSQMVALAMQVPGVQWVDAEDAPGKPNRFRRWGQSPQGEFDKGEIAMARLEIARLDNDPSLPENGKLDFFMEGGL
jgi:Baseplate J-like protein